MTNAYYAPTTLSQNTLARSGQENSERLAVEAAFDKLPSETLIKQGRVSVAADGGAANVYVLTATYPPSHYAAYMTFRFKAANTNTGASTVNVYDVNDNLLGAVALRNYAGAPLTGGEVVENAYIDIVYDNGGFFRIVNPLVTIGTLSVNNNVKVTGADTTPGTLDEKIAGAKALSKSVATPGGNEDLALSVEWGALADGGIQTTGFTAASNAKYLVNLSAGATVMLPASPAAGDILRLTISGGQAVLLGANGNKINGAVSDLPVGSDETILTLTYTGASRGWVTSLAPASALASAASLIAYANLSQWGSI